MASAAAPLTHRGRFADPVAAFLGGVAAVAGSYAAVGLTPAFVAAPVSALVVAYTPDAVVTFAILVLGDVGDLLGFALALVLTAVAFGLAALSGLRTGRVLERPVVGGLLGGVVAWLLALLLTGQVLAGLAAALPLSVVVWVAGRPRREPTAVDPSRRRLLKLAAGVAVFGGVSALVGARVGDESTSDSGGAVSQPVQQRLDAAQADSLDLAGIPGLVSETGSFYRVDINAVDPTVAVDDWTLSVTGAVDAEQTFTYEDVTGMEPTYVFKTLRCVGESLNGHKMDNALWTGVPVVDLVESAGGSLPDECCVVLHAADGYYEEFPLSALRDAVLAYEMNGETLPRAHGYPVRALVPGHWGEINVKWITEIEVTKAESTGYWEKRGWHGTGPVNTVAKFHAINHLDGGRVQVGGHAYAGTRGIDRVEVSVDGGQTWTEATLSKPLPDPDTWRQWAYEFEPSGSHEVVVRAVDGEGDVQPRDEADAFPNGPSGWVSRMVR